ncbi:MAG: ATPase [Patescibacteria group bacterium]
MGLDTIVKKADGTREAFDPDKLKGSLRRSGAQEKDIEETVRRVEGILHHDITTKKIYKKAFSELKKIKRSAAISYSLREAVKELGPTGFPFERFVAGVFSELGYETEVGVMMQGMCTEHEIDFLACHDSHNFIAEAKFHNEHGTKSDLQTALYVKARFDDLWESPYLTKDKKPHSVWLITNTKFTRSALEYGECAGINMISWNHPAKGNLQDLIEDSRRHPVTAISSLNKNEKTSLLNNEVVFCRDFVESSSELESYGIHSKKHKKALEEASFILDTYR